MHFLSSFNKNYLLSIINQVYRYYRFLFKIKSQLLNLKKYDDLKLSIKPCFIKIDVEGYDHKVIKGMIKSIKKYKPLILVELNKENFFEINEILKKNYQPFLFFFDENKFLKINNKLIKDISKNFKRDFNFYMPRNVYFIPKEFTF